MYSFENIMMVGGMLVEKCYICIDLKTFYASVECVERSKDPFHTALVVADPSKGKGAICLAISPYLKQMGIKNRCRIYEIPEDIPYITALPRMKLYMKYAADIYAIYLKYVAKEDIHVYSIDEAFLDITSYLGLYKMSPRELCEKIIQDVYDTTGICATVGIGTNLYLAKVALDICAKHIKEHIAYLDEESYKKSLWHHKPLRDFWQIGRGIENRLAKYGIEDMYDIVHTDERLLYKEFGINAEYLIDHAYGREPTTIQDIKQYRSNHTSLSTNQILFEDYCYEDALLVMKEMVETQVLELMQKHLVTNHISLRIGYSEDCYSSVGKSRKLSLRTASCKYLTDAFVSLFKEVVNKQYFIRSIGIGFGDVVDECRESYTLFDNIEEREEEKKLQNTLVEIKQKYGKNAVLKGMNLLDKATAKKRNTLVGGHNAE